MLPTKPLRHPLAGLLTTQFFGAFNDNAMKIMVALLAGDVAAGALTDATARELARQEQTTVAFLVFTVPLMLFSLPAALLADRFSKRTLIIAMKWLELAVMAGATAALFLQPSGGVVLLVLLGMMGLQSALFSPAKYGILPQLCDEQAISKGNGLLELWTFVAIIAGYGAGGALREALHPRDDLAMALLVVLSAAGLVAAFRVPPVPATGAGVRRPLRGAWQAIRRDRTLKLVIAGQAVFWTLASLLGQDVLTYAKASLQMPDFEASLTFVMFGIGVAAGSTIAGRASHRHIEPGLIPLGAIGLSTGTTLLGISAPGYTVTLAIMALLGVSAGVMLVPLEAMLQWYAPADKRGAVIAIANVPVFFGVMLGSLIVYVLAIRFGQSAAQILVAAGLLTILATLWALWLLPQALLRTAFLALRCTLYRLRVEGREHLPATGGALIVANHVSLVDWLLLLSSSDRPIRFLADSGYFHHWLLRPFMAALGAIPISAGDRRELLRAMRDAGRYLDGGELVCIFAEGEITRTGALLPFRRGLTRILKGRDVPVIPAHLDRLWGSPLSSKGGGFLKSFEGRVPRPVTLSFGEPLPPTTPVEDIRAAVKLLEERAWRLRQQRRSPLHHTLLRTCRRRPLRMAMCDTTGVRRSRIGLVAAAVLTARKLREDGWGEQERVGILLPPSVGSAVANLAAAFSGRVSVNLNYTAGAASLASVARQAGLRSVLTSRAFIERLDVALADGLTPIFLEDVAAMCTARDRLGAWLRALVAPARALERFAGAIRHPRGDDVVTVIFSSGSTGEPKGVVLTHANIDSNAEGVAQVLAVRGQDRLLGVLPQFHSFGFMALWFALNHGVGVVCHANPMDATVLGPLIEKEKVTVMIATPTFLQVYCRRCAPGQLGSLRMVVTGAEKLQPACADAFEDRFGLRPLEGYGATECAPVVAVGTAAFRAPGMIQTGSKRGAIGQPLPGVAVKVVDPDTRTALPAGEIGMLLVRGPNVMQGYLGRPDLTAAVMQDGWYVTGDLGSVDADGFVRITDRLARYSKIGGEMVPHGRIEEALHEAAERTDRVFCVTAVPDPKKGERLCVLHTLAETALPEILAALRERGLPNLFVPKLDQFVRVETIPVLGAGKTDLRKAKALAMAHASNAPTPRRNGHV